MYDCFMIIFTALSGLGAVGAIIVTICIYNRQKKIELFDMRMRILDDFEKFVFEIMPKWEWNGKIDYIERHSDQEVTALLNQEYCELKNNILQTAQKCIALVGDIDYAQKHGSCHDKTCSELEKEKFDLENELQIRFSQERRKADYKWFKI